MKKNFGHDGKSVAESVNATEMVANKKQFKNRIELVRELYQIQQEEAEKKVYDIFTRVIPEFATMENRCFFNNDGEGPADYIGFLEAMIGCVKEILGKYSKGPGKDDGLPF